MSELTFLKLKKNCKKDMTGNKVCKIGILGDCATQHLATAIKGYGIELGLDCQVFDADYNQIDAQLLDPNSEFYEFSPAYAVIYMCTEKLYHTYCENTDREHFAEAVYDQILGYWELIRSNSSSKIIQFTFVSRDDGVFGNYSGKVVSSFGYQLKKLNYLIMEGAAKTNQVFLLDLDVIQSKLGMDVFHDEKLYYIAKMPVSTTALVQVAKQVMDIIGAVGGSFKKCVITDLDNTLWGGVIGDDGLEGIQIGELGLGHAFEELQLWLKELKNRGIILAVCSKNNEDTAKEPFEKHGDMILKLDDFSLFVANWEDKASNIQFIQETLNIGMDSIVFLDDNPFERDQVKTVIPQITVPDLPSDPAMYLHYLRSLNLFETASYSAADADRTRQYQAEANRVVSSRKYADYDEYLKSLEMVAEVKPFDAFQIPRIAQLTQRSNQFNLRTVRCTEDQVEFLANSDQYITMYFTLRDKFGDHGLISIAILEKQDPDTLFVYNWLMSCRVLKRGMEEFIMNSVLEKAAELGYKKVIGEYLQTPKNAMVKDIYARLGFEDLGGGRFCADVAAFQKNRTYILKSDVVTE